MPINILMPALSPTMETGNLAKWLKKVGDKVKSGDVLAEIETDKATMEVEAIDEGILARIMVPDGTADVPVNQLIAVIASEGEDVAAIAAGNGGAQPATATAPAAPAPAVSAKETVAPSPQPEGNTMPAASNPAPVGTRVFASPLARRIASQNGVDLSRINGSGPHGRIVLADVERQKGQAVSLNPQPLPPVAKSVTITEPAKPAAAIAPPSDDKIKALFEPGSFTEIPHDGMRKIIARRLMEAKSTIPHFYLTLDCELDALLALREQINKSAPVQDGKPAYKISVNDFVIKALAMALIRVPDANVSWTENTMLKHTHADVGVAVSIPGGLITPIVRKAETKTLSAISNEMKDMANRAKSRKLMPEEYQGGSSAVSNLGMFGVKDFAAVINPPHATILAVGAGEQRVVVKNGAPAVATVMSVTLSTDHRAVDGALGAELLGAFKALIEAPLGMLV
jgi:pyruvate dehydrogenase E2 component (dihydrolipoamide acetyltransferase)